MRDFMFAGKGRQQAIERIMCRECRSLGFIITFSPIFGEVLAKQALESGITSVANLWAKGGKAVTLCK